MAFWLIFTLLFQTSNPWLLDLEPINHTVIIKHGTIHRRYGPITTTTRPEIETTTTTIREISEPETTTIPISDTTAEPTRPHFSTTTTTTTISPYQVSSTTLRPRIISEPTGNPDTTPITSSDPNLQLTITTSITSPTSTTPPAFTTSTQRHILHGAITTATTITTTSSNSVTSAVPTPSRPATSTNPTPTTGTAPKTGTERVDPNVNAFEETRILETSIRNGSGPQQFGSVRSTTNTVPNPDRHYPINVGNGSSDPLQRGRAQENSRHAHGDRENHGAGDTDDKRVGDPRIEPNNERIDVLPSTTPRADRKIIDVQSPNQNPFRTNGDSTPDPTDHESDVLVSREKDGRNAGTIGNGDHIHQRLPGLGKAERGENGANAAKVGIGNRIDPRLPGLRETSTVPTTPVSLMPSSSSFSPPMPPMENLNPSSSLSHTPTSMENLNPSSNPSSDPTTVTNHTNVTVNNNNNNNNIVSVSVSKVSVSNVTTNVSVSVSVPVPVPVNNASVPNVLNRPNRSVTTTTTTTLPPMTEKPPFGNNTLDDIIEFDPDQLFDTDGLPYSSSTIEQLKEFLSTYPSSNHTQKPIQLNVDIVQVPPSVHFRQLGWMAGSQGYAHLLFVLNLPDIWGNIRGTCLCANHVQNISMKPIFKKQFRNAAMEFKVECHNQRQTYNQLMDSFIGTSLIADETDMPFRLAEVERHKRQGMIIAGLTGLLLLADYGVTKYMTDPIIARQGELIEVIHENRHMLNREHHDLLLMNKTVSVIANHTRILQDQKRLQTAIGLCHQEVHASNRYLDSVRMSLYELLRGRLHPDLINRNTLLMNLDRITSKLERRGYRLVKPSLQGIYNADISYGTDARGRVVVLIHLPSFYERSLLELYEFLPTPRPLRSGAFVIFNPPRTLLGISPNNGNFLELDHNEFLHCRKQGPIFYCRNNNVTKKKGASGCLSHLFRNDLIQIRNYCLNVSKFYTGDHQTVAQLTSHQFFAFFSENTNLDIECPNSNISDISRTLRGHYLIDLPVGCRAETDSLVFSPDGTFFTPPLRVISVHIPANVSAWFLNNDTEGLADVIRDLRGIPTEPISYDDIKSRIGDLSYAWGISLPKLNFGIAMTSSIMALLIGVSLTACCYIRVIRQSRLLFAASMPEGAPDPNVMEMQPFIQPPVQDININLNTAS